MTNLALLMDGNDFVFGDNSEIVPRDPFITIYHSAEVSLQQGTVLICETWNAAGRFA